MSTPELGPPWAVGPDGWLAKVPYDRWNDRWVEKDSIVVHYGGGPNKAGSPAGDPFQQAQDEQDVLQSWEQYHLSKGWRGLAYNYAIGQSGAVYRARGWNHNGAHYSNDDVDGDGLPENQEGVAVVFILGGDQQPTDAAYQAFRMLRAWLEDQVGAAMRLWGHREVAASGGHSTSCPGEILMAWVESERDEGGAPPVSEIAEVKAEIGDIIGDVQQALANAGFDPGEIDGIWGPVTFGAFGRLCHAAAMNAGVADHRHQFGGFTETGVPI